MVVSVSYNPVTNVMVPIAGTQGVSGLIIDLLQHDFDTPYTLLDAAVIDADPDEMSLDNPVRAKDSRGLRLLISADVDRAGATVDIVGRDADGDSVTESGIDIATALTTAVETESKYSQIYTVTFNNMVNGDSVSISQPRLGVISAGLEPDLVVNGGFDVDANWTKQDGWNIVGGIAVCDGLQPARTAIFQNIALGDYPAGTIFKATTRIVSISAGIFEPFGIGFGYAHSFINTGLHTYFLQSDGAFNHIFLTGIADFASSIDNVTVQKLTSQYGIGCKIEFGDGSTPSWFESYGESVRFDAGMTYETKANAVLKQDWNRRMYTASEIGMLPVGSKGLA